MATSLRRIEKEFVLGSAKDEGAKVLLLAGEGEWPVSIVSVDSKNITLSHGMPLRLLRRGQEYEFRFVYREQAMAFRSRVSEVKDATIVVAMPESVFKNLGRRYSRRSPPPGFEASFSFLGDRYELAFPRGNEFDPVERPEPSRDFDPADIRLLVHEFNEKAAEYASDRAIIMWKERVPESEEERIVVRTGRCFFLPSAAGGLPEVDPYMRPRLVTRDQFAEWLREEGVAEDLVASEVVRFERRRRDEGVLSSLLVPVIFQEYVIGCVSLVNRTPGKAPFDLTVLDKFVEFSKVLAYSLKINGYFKGAPKSRSGIPADALDVSAGGILFSNGSRELAASLLPGTRVEVSMSFGPRSMRTGARLKRTYRDSEAWYYGLEYEAMAPEDFRFLFEALYGRAFTDADENGVEGLGVREPLDLGWERRDSGGPKA